MARMPTLLELSQMDRNRGQARAMDEFFSATQMPVAPAAVQPAPQPAPQPARAPVAAPMQAQAPAAPKQPRGLLGGFFGPEGRDARARLAIALEGLALNPNQALIGQLQQGIEGRAAEKQRNATIEWLLSRGHDDLAAALKAGASPQDVLAEATRRMQPAPAGFRQVTGAQLGLTGADAQKLFNVSPEGQVTAIGGAGTTVHVDAGTGGKFEETFAKSDAERLAMVEDTGLASIRNVARIDRLDQLLQTAPQGAMGGLKAFAGEFGIATEGLNEIQAAQGLINALVPEQRAPGSGPMSDGDLALFKQSLPRIINQPGGNRAIVQTMRAIALYDAQGAEIVQRLRNQEIDRTEAFRLLKDRPDPLAGIRDQMGDGVGAPTGSSTQPVVIDGVTIRKVN